VVPTLGRPGLLARALRYYASVGLDCPILIADGSPEGTEAVAAAVEEQVGQLDVQVQTRRGLKLFERLAATVATVSTGCVVIAADDDFQVPTGLAAAVTRLDADPTLASVCGRAVAFTARAGGLDLAPYAQLPYLGATALDRICGYRSATSTFYAVRRTASARLVFSALADLGLDDGFGAMALGEIADTSLTLAHGSVGWVGELVLVKEVGSPDATSRQAFRSMTARLLDPRWAPLVGAFAEALADEIEQASGTRPGEDDLERCVESVIGAQLGGKLRALVTPPPNRFLAGLSVLGRRVDRRLSVARLTRRDRDTWRLIERLVAPE
jgi:glycosyltransferase domain-containing protein